jgi:hypothetical protein
MIRALTLFLLFFFSVAAALSSAQSIPAIRAKALDDSEITLPGPGSRQVLILIVGFSRKSGKVCEDWSRKISADYHADNRVAYFSLPVLESAPSLVRPMIVYGMRKGVPKKELRRFVPLYSKEAEWKKFVNISAPDDAYLIVTTPEGLAVWQSHGPFSDAVYLELKKSVASLLENATRPSAGLQIPHAFSDSSVPPAPFVPRFCLQLLGNKDFREWSTA